MATLDEIYNERLNLLDNPPKANPIGQPILPEAGVQFGVTYTLDETTNQIVPVQEGVGTGIRLPGRKLMAEDEFFKVADSEGDVGVVGNVLSGIGKGVVQGAQEAGTQIGDTLTSGYWSSTIAPMLRENVPGLDAANQFAQENLQPEGQVQEVTASIASPLSQILVPGALATRAIRAAGVGSRILAETFGYSAAEVAAVSPETTTLMEMGLEAIDNDPQVQSLIEKAFAVQMDENDFMMRLKNLPRKVIEGGVTGVIAERAFEGIGMFYRAMKNSPTLKAAAARYAEGKSPVPVGMSIEDVSPSKVAIDDFDAYVREVDPSNKVIPAENRPNLRMGDMYGMLPKTAEVVQELDNGVTLYRATNGDYYATTYNPDVGEEDVVGYILGRDNGTELAVVEEMQGKGIGSELQYMFRSENPFAPTSGLTDAGKRRLEQTYDRLRDDGVFENVGLDEIDDIDPFEAAANLRDLTVADINPGQSKKIKDRIKLLRDTIPGFRNVVKYLTPQEAKKMKANSASAISKIFAEMPEASEMASVAFAGRAKRGWYQRSARALVEVFGADDAPRFAGLLAAMSPQTSVESNTINALHTWINWTKAGRPTDRQAILEIMGQSVQGDKGIDSVLPAWQNNSVLSLSSGNPREIVLSGAKVNSFMLNLLNVVHEVTNDAWMANYTGVPGIANKLSSASKNVAGTDPGKGSTYLALSAVARKAASVLTKRTGESWTPREVQETVWSWAKTLVEKGEAAGEDRRLRAILAAGDMTHFDIADTPDFELLFVEGIYKKILSEGGFDAQIKTVERSVARRGGVDGSDRIRGSSFKSEGSGLSESSFQRDLNRAADRLERRRSRGE